MYISPLIDIKTKKGWNGLTQHLWNRCLSFGTGFHKSAAFEKSFGYLGWISFKDIRTTSVVDWLLGLGLIRSDFNSSALNESFKKLVATFVKKEPFIWNFFKCSTRPLYVCGKDVLHMRVDRSGGRSDENCARVTVVHAAIRTGMNTE